jgi:hypothetical protein
LDRLSPLAEDLVRLRVDVILARASSGALAAERATSTIPVVSLPSTRRSSGGGPRQPA